MSFWAFIRNSYTCAYLKDNLLKEKFSKHLLEKDFAIFLGAKVHHSADVPTFSSEYQLLREYMLHLDQEEAEFKKCQ